jgi:SAM-dependent methyltransferase
MSSSKSVPLRGNAARVGQHYDKYAPAEAARLEQFCPVEYAITLRYLSCFIPEGGKVAEIGVGAGHYSEFLARRGCSLHLADVSKGLLRTATERLQNARLGSKIIGIHHATATDLPIASSSIDAVLLLGPLYHLLELEERQRAVREAARVLKPLGIVVAAGINRLTFLRDMFRCSDKFSKAFFGDELANAGKRFPQELSSGGFVAGYLASGNLDPQHAPPIGYAHLTSVAEFRELLTTHFEELALVGAESFTTAWQDLFQSKPAEEAAAWLDIVETTGRMPEGLAFSDHFLFVGKKREDGSRSRRLNTTQTGGAVELQRQRDSS